jgi:hypothetical protein
LDAMQRTVWLALICLVSLGVLVALRTNIGARAVPGEITSAGEPRLPPPIDDPSPLAKSDRLPSPYFDSPQTKETHPIKIVPTAPERADAPKPANPLRSSIDAKSQAKEVTSWHWHVGSSITKRNTAAGPR